MLGNFVCYNFSFADFYSKLTFFNYFFLESIRVPYSLDLVQADILSGLVWAEAVCKGYQ